LTSDPVSTASVFAPVKIRIFLLPLRRALGRFDCGRRGSPVSWSRVDFDSTTAADALLSILVARSSFHFCPNADLILGVRRNAPELGLAPRVVAFFITYCHSIWLLFEFFNCV
jgi:hypothetical protein